MAKSKTKALHQFSLFGYQPPRIRMSKEERDKLIALVREGKVKFAKRDALGTLRALRGMNDVLTNFERRISNGR